MKNGDNNLTNIKTNNNGIAIDNFTVSNYRNRNNTRYTSCMVLHTGYYMVWNGYNLCKCDKLEENHIF